MFVCVIAVGTFSPQREDLSFILHLCCNSFYLSSVVVTAVCLLSQTILGKLVLHLFCRSSTVLEVPTLRGEVCLDDEACVFWSEMSGR